MQSATVSLSVPAQAQFARSVRILASSLAAMCDMSIDDVEDVRIAAEEGFIWACGTQPETCDVSFALTDAEVAIEFTLGSQEEVPTTTLDPEQSVDFVELLLDAVCDDFYVIEAPEGDILHLVKKIGAANAS